MRSFKSFLIAAAFFLPAFLAPTSSAIADVTRDGPQLVARPASLAEWQDLGGDIPVPDYYWRFQETSGNLIDDVHDVPLVAAGTVSYGQALTGWTSTFVATTNGVAGGWSAPFGAAWDVATQDVCVKLDAKITSQTTARAILILAGANELLDIGTTGKLVSTPGITGGTFVYDDGLVHPFFVELLGGAGMTNHTGAGIWRISTDKEQITGIWHIKGDNVKGIGTGGVTGALPPTALYNSLTGWVGHKCSAMSAKGIKIILQQFAWSVTGY